MIKELTISQKNLDLILTELEDNRPYEACGVMIGTTNDNVTNVEKVIHITNVRRTAASFELDPQQFYNTWNDAEKNGNEIVGIYNSGARKPWCFSTRMNCIKHPITKIQR